MKSFSVNYYLIFVLFFVICCFANCYKAETLPECSKLLFGQYRCSEPVVNNVTNEVEGCTSDRQVEVVCLALEDVNCMGDRNWKISLPCRYTNGYYFSTALSLSVFLGVFGIDRFYLGYPVVGLVKLFTFGGFLIGNWADIICISTQVLIPADGSDYVIKVNGPPILSHSTVNEDTYFKPLLPYYDDDEL